ncbi:MAG: S8 family serine peptidase [Solirubrobacterales bacterium]
MTRRLPTLIAATLLSALAVLAGAAAPAGAKIGVSAAQGFAPHQIVVKFSGERSGQAVALPRGVGVPAAAAALNHSPQVAYAEPNYTATASLFVPNDSGTLPSLTGTAAPTTPDLTGHWVTRQWNFLPYAPGTPGVPTSPGGINAVGAWRNLIAAGRAGARGVTVAVLDTGIAYRNLGHRPGGGARYLRSPDFSAKQFVPGYNFVENNHHPVDANGHGTHVASTIAEETDNGIGLTGLAYKAKLMPVQVLNAQGRGQASNIAKGIHFAAEHGAQVINMSFNFGCGKKVPVVDEALRDAARRGIVLVASVGNIGAESCVSPPATEPGVIGVGGTTEGGCLGDYSLAGEGVDLVAPGGGIPATGCPSILSAPIYQVTLNGGGGSNFGIPDDYVGTSMAAAHVSGVAAMVIASGVLGKVPAQSLDRRVSLRLKATARSLGLPPTEQGAGLIDAARATAPPPAQ